MPFAAVLRHQLSPYENQVSPYKPLECRTCEPHLATRHLTEEGPCHSQAGQTHWRNNARTSAARKLCTQHKCRPQGGGQSTTALVADLIIVEEKVLQRRIRLVKIPRTCRGAAWSTHLTDVDNHVRAMTLDEKLVDLQHFMPCPAGRGHCRHGKRTSKVLLLCQVMAQVVMLCRSLACEIYTPPQHITKDLWRRASLP